MPANEWFNFVFMMLMLTGFGALAMLWVRHAMSWRPNYIILGIGIGLLFLSGLLYANVHHFLRNAMETHGTVVGFSRELNISSGGSDSFPLIEFQTQEGERIRFKEPGNFGFRVSVGDRVGVLYNPQNPSEARSRSWSSLWGWSLITVSIGSSAVAIALWDLSRRWR